MGKLRQISLLDLQTRISFCHPYYFKKGIPYRQVLRLNRICSNNEILHRRCNDLEKWLMERGYKEKMMRNQILSTQEHFRNDALEKEQQQMSEEKTNI